MRYHLDVAGDKFVDNGIFDFGDFATVEDARQAYLKVQWADVYSIDLFDRETGETTHPEW